MDISRVSHSESLDIHGYLQAQLKLDRRFGGRFYTCCTFYTLYILGTSLTQGKRESSKRQMVKGKLKKGKGETGARSFAILFHYATRRRARTLARHDTKRFPGWTHPQPPIHNPMVIHGYLWISISMDDTEAGAGRPGEGGEFQHRFVFCMRCFGYRREVPRKLGGASGSIKDNLSHEF